MGIAVSFVSNYDVRRLERNLYCLITSTRPKKASLNIGTAMPRMIENVIKLHISVDVWSIVADRLARRKVPYLNPIERSKHFPVLS